MKVLLFVALFVLSVTAAVVLIGQLELLHGTVPSDLGVRNNRLKPPSPTPNSVSSQSNLYPHHPQRDYASIAPLAFVGDADVAMANLVSILKRSERVEVVTQSPDYIYAQCTTPVMKFTDDLEFWLDRSAGVIHVRSASRLGSKDFNTNRIRVEAIRREFSKR